MRDYWLTQYILAAVGWGYVLVSVAAIALALWLPKGKRSKAVATLIVVGLASILPLQGYQGYQKQNEAAELHRGKLAKAQALFEERCKTAGEKIYRTAEGVDGLLLMNVRPDRSSAVRSDPMWADAALPDESVGDWYVISFLGWEQRRGGQPGSVNVVPTEYPGYAYVDVLRADKSVTRYVLVKDGRGWGNLTEVKRNGAMPDFAVDYVNDVDPELRENWIAGTRIVITDLRTHEVIAERQSYAFEPGLGSTVGSRSPWGFAVGCPRSVSGSQTRNFVEKVLKKRGA